MGGGGLIRFLTVIPEARMPRLSLSTMSKGAITLQVRGGGVVVGLSVIVVEMEPETEVDLLGLREIEGVREEVREEEGGIPIVPTKLYEQVGLSFV